MAQTQLLDLLVSYPPQMNQNIQELITAKEEFRQGGAIINEKLPQGKGNYFAHQIFTHRYLREYDDYLILDEPGTGKSCSVIGFTEYVIKEMEKAAIDPNSADEKVAHFKNIIILANSKNHLQEIRKQLVCKCSDGRYETEIVKEASNEATQKGNVTRELNRVGYKLFPTYYKFIQWVNNNFRSKEQIIAGLSDSIFWIDEAHNLSITEEERRNSDNDDIKLKVDVYNQIWNIFHTALRCKRILSTATPMINYPGELSSLLNLILPKDGEIPRGYDIKNIPDNDRRVLFPGLPSNYRNMQINQIASYFKGQIPRGFNYKTANINDMEPYIRGRVNFVRLDPVVNINYVAKGEPQGELHIEDLNFVPTTILTQTNMYEHQRDGFLKAYYGNDDTEKKKNNAFKSKVLQASNFVFPDGTWGKGKDDESGSFGFSKYVEADKEHIKAKPEFIKHIKSIDVIKNYSAKYAYILKRIQESDGICYIYSRFTYGSGAIVLALCLEHALGFKRYNYKTSMFESSSMNEIKSFCANDTDKRKTANISKGLRYALLTQDTSIPQADSMLEALNSNENMHGEYIKVVIFSKVGREGLNINNSKNIFILSPEWNESNMEQARGRGIRATSHLDMLEEKRQELVNRNLNPDDAKITVNIYNMAAITGDPDDNLISTDITIYNLAEYKSRLIHRIFRMIKQIAVTCQLHYNHNYVSNGIDYSKECDYDLCKYECFNQGPDQIDYSTYDILYLNKDISAAISEIVNQFNHVNFIKFTELILILTQFREIVILMALTHIIYERMVITDSFGFPCHLKEDSGYYYLDRGWNKNIDSAVGYYSSNIVTVKDKTLTELTNIINKEVGAKLYEQIYKASDVYAFINEIPIIDSIELLENAILRKVEGNDDKVNQDIREYFKSAIFEINEPVTMINKIIKEKLDIKPKRGRKEDPTKTKRIKRVKIDTKLLDNNTELVWLHTLYISADQSLTKFNVTSKSDKAEGRLRLLKPSENKGWRDLTDIEFKVYNPVLQYYIEQRKTNIVQETGGIYGTMDLGSGHFRIIDKTVESARAKSNATSVKRGIVCTSLKVSDLIEVFWKVNKPATDLIVELDRETLIDYLWDKKATIHSKEEISTWPTDRLKYYYEYDWYIKHAPTNENAIYRRKSKAVVCDELYQHFYENGLIFEIA